MCRKSFGPSTVGKASSWRSLLRALALVWILAGGLYGLSSAKVADFKVMHPCSQPTQLLWAPDVDHPVEFGLLSGISLGAYPRLGFGAPTACLDVDAGRGIAQAQWPLMLLATAKTWACARAAGFALAFALLWWALLWPLRAARVLLWSRSSPRKESPSSTAA